MSFSQCRLILRSSGFAASEIFLKSTRHHPRCLSFYTKTLLIRRIPSVASTSDELIKLATATSIKSSSRVLAGCRALSTQALRPYVDPKLSYAYGRSNDQLIYSTVTRELERQVNETPDEVIFASYSENIQVTYREFKQDVDRLAKSLVMKFGIKKNDAVGVFSYNCYNWLVIQFACSKIGAILTPINPSYKPSELAFVLKKGEIKCLFLPGPCSAQSELNKHLEVLQSEQVLDMSKKKELQLRHVVFLDGTEYSIHKTDESSSSTIDSDNQKVGATTIEMKLDNCVLHNWSETQQGNEKIFKSIQEAEEAGVREQDACILNPDLLSPDDTFAVYYTSGTTGTPKGAVVSQFCVINNVLSAQKRLRTGRPDSWKGITVTTLPLFHIFAGVLISLSPILSNSKVILSNFRYDMSKFVKAIIENQANTINVTPTILIDMLEYIEANKLTDLPLRIVQSGGAFLQSEVAARCFKIIPQLEELRTGYGSTENGGISTLQTIHEPAEIRSQTVGAPIDFTEVRIVVPKTNKVVPHMVQGEIQTRGHNTMIEYLGEPDKTNEVVTSTRWYKTGDIGLMHPHGSVQVCGRIKNMIIKGGENVYPEEVEKLIHSLEFVEDVHVVGVPDKRFGEQVCAWVKLRASYKESTTDNSTIENEISKNDIIEFCKQNITYFKVPKYLLFVDEFPMTPTKKVQAHKMIQMSIDKLNLHDQVSSSSSGGSGNW